MEENKFSLLTQSEIDSLVEYLKGKDANIDSVVLDQESIDKLIRLMQTYRGNTLEGKGVRSISEVLVGNKTWILETCIDEASGFVELYATNGEKKEIITPGCFANGCFMDDDTRWGFSIAPAVLCNVASLYGVRFTKETYEQVMKQFAKVNYGAADYPIPEYYCADNKGLSIHLIEKM